MKPARFRRLFLFLRLLHNHHRSASRESKVTILDNELSANDLNEVLIWNPASDILFIAEFSPVFILGKTKTITLKCFRTTGVPTKEQVYPHIDLTVV